MRARLAHHWDILLSGLWFVPSLVALLSVALAFLTLRLDRSLPSQSIATVSWIWTGGPEGAYSLLSALAASMITVAGTVFSISIVVLTLASSQFGPRLLRNFLRDTGNQLVLGTFIGTFAYCLLVLRTVRAVDESPFVPNISVTVAVGLALLSIGVLIYYIHHVSVSIQAPQIVAAVGRSLNANVRQLFPRRLGEGDQDHARRAEPQIPPDLDRTAYPVAAAHTGYIASIDADGMLQLTTAHDLVLRLLHHPGDFIVPGTTLVRAWPREHVTEKLADAIEQLFVLSTQRTPLQDVEFLFNELVEVAVRALSPAINDPFTAMACTDWLGAALCHLAESELPSPYRYDEAGSLRVIATPVTFAQAVAIAFDQIREYGRSSTAVTIRLLDTLATIAEHVTTAADGGAVRRQARLIVQGSRDGIGEVEDRQRVEGRYRVVDQVLLERFGTAGAADSGWAAGWDSERHHGGDDRTNAPLTDDTAERTRGRP